MKSEEKRNKELRGRASKEWRVKKKETKIEEWWGQRLKSEEKKKQKLKSGGEQRMKSEEKKEAKNEEGGVKNEEWRQKAKNEEWRKIEE